MKAPILATAMLAVLTAAATAQAQSTTQSTTQATTQGTAAAGADAAGTTALVEAEDRAMLVGSLNMTVDQLDDVDIYTTGGERIGEVDEVLMTPDGRVVGVTAEIGGFLGIGDREMILPLDQVSLVDGRLVTPLTKAQMEALDSWDD